MDDKRTPMEAEVQELPDQREPAELKSFYGTAAKPKPHRDHSWILICISLAMIAGSTYFIVSNITRMRARKDGGQNDWVLGFQVTEQTEVTESTAQNLEVTAEDLYVSAYSGESSAVELHLASGEGEELLPEQVYAMVSPAVACIQVETYYGNEYYSGVVVSADGYLLTAVEELGHALSITVFFPNGTRYVAELVREDRSTGLCLLKVAAKELPTVAFAQDGALTVGERVYCICNPYGTQIPNIFYDWILAGCGSVKLNGSTYSVLQSTAQLNGVSYGCPILDERGLVIGLTTPIGKKLASAAGADLALSAADLARTIESFERSDDSVSLWLGITVEEIPEDYRYLFELTGKLWVTDVAVDSALNGVMFQYDEITEVDGVPVNTVEEFEQMIAKHDLREKLRFTVFRNGKTYTIWLTVLVR